MPAEADRMGFCAVFLFLLLPLLKQRESEPENASYPIKWASDGVSKMSEGRKKGASPGREKRLLIEFEAEIRCEIRYLLPTPISETEF